MPAPTLRSLGRQLGLSRTTVSDAIRGSSRVNPETAKRVREAAKAAGYKHNALAGALMSEIRRSRSQVFGGVLAMIDVEEPGRSAQARQFNQDVIAGVTKRGAELGFKAELFTVQTRRQSLIKLNTILEARDIRGLILLPACVEWDWTTLNWERCSGIYTGYAIDRPPLHSICSDHYPSLVDALERLIMLGYRRPGMFLDRSHDMKLQYGREAAFLAFQRRTSGIAAIPPLLMNRIAQEEFTPWFRQHQPDVVLGPRSEVVPWMEACGARIPDTHGFLCLNILMQPTPCAGLDLKPQVIGALCAESLISRLNRNELGIPERCARLQFSATWVDGPTLRTQPIPARRSRKGVTDPSRLISSTEQGMVREKALGKY